MEIYHMTFVTHWECCKMFYVGVDFFTADTRVLKMRWRYRSFFQADRAVAPGADVI